jgi:DNA-binding transcriptional regulator GbsR (MarR family)
MNWITSPEKDFIELMATNARNNGLDELSSRIISILYAEPMEMSLQEIARRTGYSLSAISTSMKFLEGTRIVKRTRKPKSKKVYFYIGKDLLEQFQEAMRIKYETNVLESKKVLPDIIKRYKREKKRNNEKLKIMENYYKQILFSEIFMKKSLILLEELKKGGKR